MQKQTRPSLALYVIFSCVVAWSGLAHAQPLLNADTPRADTPTIESGLAYIDESLVLRRKALRHGISAGVTYGASAVLLGYGTALLIPQECIADANDSAAIDRCSALSVRPINGSILLSAAGGSILAIALPLHRSANQHRRMSNQLALGSTEEFSMLTYQGAKRIRLGRNYLIGGAALAFTALTSFVVPATVGEGLGLSDVSLSISVGSAMSAFVVGVTGARIHLRGKRLARRGNAAPPAQALVAPAFYGDGAGLSLYMGF